MADFTPAFIFCFVVGVLVGAGLLRGCQYGCEHIDVTVEAK